MLRLTWGYDIFLQMSPDVGPFSIYLFIFEIAMIIYPSLFTRKVEKQQDNKQTRKEKITKLN